MTRRQPRPASSTTGQPAVSKSCARDFVQESADRLGRALKGRVVAVDQGLGDIGDAAKGEVALVEFVAQRLLQHVADAALGVGHDEVHRRGVHLGRGEFVALQDVADLRAVAVGDDGAPAGLDEVGDVGRGFANGVPLVLHLRMLRVLDERVAADGDEGQRRPM